MSNEVLEYGYKSSIHGRPAGRIKGGSCTNWESTGSRDRTRGQPFSKTGFRGELSRKSCAQTSNLDVASSPVFFCGWGSWYFRINCSGGPPLRQCWTATRWVMGGIRRRVDLGASTHRRLGPSCQVLKQVAGVQAAFSNVGRRVDVS